MYNIIKSKSNKYFSLIKKLSIKKYRKQEGLFIIEGIKLIDEAIKNKKNIELIAFNSSFLEKNPSFLTDKISKYNYFVFEDELFFYLTEMKSPEGVLGLVSIDDEKEVNNDRVLLLDGLKDPGNLGTIIRSCDAFDFRDIVLINDCCDPYNSKVIRSSMGSIFRVNIKEADINFVKKLKDKGYSLYSSSLDKKGQKPILDKKIILTIGSESHGVSDEVYDITDFYLKIKMCGNIDSLNAGVAASILMHDIYENNLIV